jgi:hypothetical protein
MAKRFRTALPPRLEEPTGPSGIPPGPLRVATMGWGPRTTDKIWLGGDLAERDAQSNGDESARRK